MKALNMNSKACVEAAEHQAQHANPGDLVDEGGDARRERRPAGSQRARLLAALRCRALRRSRSRRGFAARDHPDDTGRAQC